MYFKRKIDYNIALLAALLALFLISSLTQSVWAEKSADKPTLPLSPSREPRRAVTVVATGYSSTPDQTDETPFITATGARVYDGLIAANWLPFGAQVKFPELYGDKIFMVDDRMNERYGYGRIDIWFDAPRDEVRKFGVKKLRMEIY